MPRTATSSTAPRKGLRCHIAKHPELLQLVVLWSFLTPTHDRQRHRRKPIDSFQNRSQFEDSEVLQMTLSVTDDAFGVDPHARSESCTHPTLLFVSFFPSSNSVHHRNGIRELTFCLDCVVQNRPCPSRRTFSSKTHYLVNLASHTILRLAKFLFSRPKWSFFSSHSSVLFDGSSAKNIRSCLETDNICCGDSWGRVSNAHDDNHGADDTPNSSFTRRQTQPT